MKWVRIYIAPSLLTFMNIPKGLSRKKLKRTLIFFFEFTHRNALPGCIPWHLFMLNTFPTRADTHIITSVPRCHWQTVQIVPSNLCLDHLWKIACQGTRGVLSTWVCLCQFTSICWFLINIVHSSVEVPKALVQRKTSV